MIKTAMDQLTTRMTKTQGGRKQLDTAIGSPYFFFPFQLSTSKTNIIQAFFKTKLKNIIIHGAQAFILNRKKLIHPVAKDGKINSCAHSPRLYLQKYPRSH